MTPRPEAEDRLLEVLLAEELGNAEALPVPGGDTTARHPTWLAAALLLLGLAVVAGAFALRRAPAVVPAARPASQDPAPAAKERQRVVPRDADEFKRWLGDLRAVHGTRRPAGVPLLGDLPVLGTLFTNGKGASEPLDDEDEPATEVFALTGAAALRPWAEALAQCAPGQPPTTVVLVPLLLDLGDDRSVYGLLHASAKALVLEIPDGPTFALPTTLADLVRQACDDAALARRRTRGIARDARELHDLPATTRALRLPCLPAEVLRAELPRLPEVERLRLVAVGVSQAPGRDAVAALATLPKLRALGLPADALDDEAFSALAALRLDELRLAGHLRHVAPTAFARLRTVGRLVLELTAADDGVRPLLTALPRLQELTLARADLLTADTVDALLATKVVRLVTTGEGFTAAIAERLAGLPSLRELEVTQTVDAGLPAALAHWPHLALVRLPKAAADGPRGQAIAEMMPRVKVLFGK